LWEVCDFFS